MIMSNPNMTCLHSTQRSFASHLFTAESNSKVSTFIFFSVPAWISYRDSLCPIILLQETSISALTSASSTSGYFFFFINNLHGNLYFIDMALGTPTGSGRDSILLTTLAFLFGYNSSTFTAAVTHGHNNGDNPAKPTCTGIKLSHVAVK